MAIDEIITINNNGSMKGRRVFVTGAGTGIGRGIALEFAKEGAAVALHYYNEEEGVSSALDMIKRAGGKATGLKGDFRDLGEVYSVADAALSFLGGVDVLVNNAGITVNVPFEKVTPEIYDTLMNVNVRAPYFLTQHLSKSMVKQRRGHIINFASLHGYHAMREHSVYASTKAAIVAMTRNLAIELAPYGIRMNALVPGWCLTENHYKAEPGLDFAKAAIESVPAGRQSSPEEIGKLAVFLATPLADHFVGTAIHYDGGIGALFPSGIRFQDPLSGKYGRDYVHVEE